MTGYRPDDTTRWQMTERKRDWLMVIPAVGLFLLVAYFTTREKALASVMMFLTFYVLVTQTWGHRREKWYKVTIAGFAVLHVLVICLVPLPSPLRPSIVYVFPVTFADGFVMFGILRWLASKLSRSNVTG